MAQNSGDTENQPTNPVSPDIAPAAPQSVQQPSLLSPPQIIELGESYDPRPTPPPAGVRPDVKIEKK